MESRSQLRSRKMSRFLRDGLKRKNKIILLGEVIMEIRIRIGILRIKEIV
jgi:hypothetical protein